MEKLDLQAFKSSLAPTAAPADLSLALRALWWDAKGDWDKGAPPRAGAR